MHSQSPALRELVNAVRHGIPDALGVFWRHAATAGTPLVEPDPEGDPAWRLVTFLLRDDAARPATDVLALLHTVTDKDRHAKNLAPHLMEKLPGTDVWAISHRLRADHRASYQFFVAHGPREETLRADRASWLRVLDEAVPDPLSTRPQLPSRDGRNPSSEMELPDAPVQEWAAPRAGTARGERTEAVVDGRRVHVHLPAGHRAGGGPYPVVVLLDGEMWGPVLDFGTALDNLYADERLPEAVTLMVDTMGRARRMEDLSCSEEFVDWMADVLLPWAARSYGAADDPARTVVAGQSAGGLTAAFAAFRRPERFGNALSQSGSFWWPDGTEFDGGSEWLTRQFAVSEKRPVRLRVEVGLQEWMLLPQNRHLRNVLEARGYEVAYGEFNGGHDYACWRGGLATGLAALLGDRG
ncbi:enterochelin esterase [Streptomyces roseoverticillatus]|uniref:enterochelin esterase n=1 Tax=Streptomyces roseoverticillatus TaxID=66429 RepID=UPI001F15D273|nr:enterochelin esterase [Streptomyces roseoverticillatus]MCF3103565.1 enterochelin esterase [Streptomyces roseoverticillatus]